MSVLLEQALRSVLVAELRPDRPFGPDAATIRDLTSKLEAAVRQVAAFQRLQGTSEAQVVRDFLTWRDDVDCENLLDPWDLALGYFSGRGFSIDDALRWAEHSRDGLVHDKLRQLQERP